MCSKALMFKAQKSISLPCSTHTRCFFVKDQELLFNVLICQDIVRGYARKGISPRCIMKIDLHKAFHLVYWPFIRELLNHLKFLTQFVKWIMALPFSLMLTDIWDGPSKEGGVSNKGTPFFPCCLSWQWSISPDWWPLPAHFLTSHFT